jgi:hypothetical protein
VCCFLAQFPVRFRRVPLLAALVLLPVFPALAQQSGFDMELGATDLYTTDLYTSVQYPYLDTRVYFFLPYTALHIGYAFYLNSHDLGDMMMQVLEAGINLAYDVDLGADSRLELRGDARFDYYLDPLPPTPAQNYSAGFRNYNVPEIGLALPEMGRSALRPVLRAQLPMTILITVNNLIANAVDGNAAVGLESSDGWGFSVSYSRHFYFARYSQRFTGIAVRAYGAWENRYSDVGMAGSLTLEVPANFGGENGLSLTPRFVMQLTEPLSWWAELELKNIASTKEVGALPALGLTYRSR